MKIIDCRCRPPIKEVMDFFSDWYKKVIWPKLASFPFPHSAETQSIELFWQEMEEAGIDKAVFSWRANPDFPGGIGKSLTNDHMAQLVKTYPDKIVGIAAIDPTNRLHQAVPEIERAINTLGLRGVAVETGALVPPRKRNDPLVDPIYAKCQELEVPVFVFATPLIGENLSWVHPADIEDVARRYRKLNIIVVHGGWPYVMETLGVAYRNRNIIIMPTITVFQPGGDLWFKALEQGYLQNQFLFASAYPLHPMKETVDAWKKVRAKKEVMEKVFHGNAERLLRL